MPDVYAIVRQAIVDKHQIVGMYHGRWREMCPHAIGTKKGVRNALCYQFAGDSEKGLGPPGSLNNWRCIHIDELTEVESRLGEWHTAPNHSRKAPCIDFIDAEVDY
jgi:hypothetical protein